MKNNYKKLAEFGSELLFKKSLLDGLPFISKYAKEIIEADRCSIFINDLEKGELWTTLSDGIDKIVIPQGTGIVGQTISEAKIILENDVQNNTNFMSDIDKNSGYKTHNIIASPIFDSNRNVVGVLELLNKNGGFDTQDEKFMKFFSHYISGFLELVMLTEK